MAKADWLDELDEPAPADVLARVKASLANPVSQQEGLVSLRDEILGRALIIMDDSLHWRDIDPGQDSEKIPEEWLREGLSLAEAKKRMRVARAAHLSMKECPAGLLQATKVALGIMAANATEKSAPRTLNVQQVFMTQPMPNFPVRVVE